jgi:two-component system, chemotaxis family, sensor kinase CheA
MLSPILKFLQLPPEISAFERQYLARVNRLTNRFFVGHIPVFALIAWLNKTGPLQALLLTTLVAAGPVIGYRLVKNPRTMGLLYGVTAMLMGGLLVHFGQGPVQIEMHFYFFALLAMLALFGNPLAILTAAGTVAVHHLLVWLWLPQSVFNYDAPWWVVAVHAAFVVLESVATIYIARSFFDNVIGLEKVVQERTAQLSERSRAMRLVLDNVDQGLLPADATGTIGSECSATLARWFAEPQAGVNVWDFFHTYDPEFAINFQLAWEQLVDGFLPAEVTLDLFPTRLNYNHCHYEFVYRQLLDNAGAHAGLLLVIADVTAEVERERLEQENRDATAVIDRLLSDRRGFIEFLGEAEELLATINDPNQPLPVFQRALHTLKGNCNVFGIQRVADHCHELEDHVVREDERPPQSKIDGLHATWRGLRQRVSALVGDTSNGRIEIEAGQYQRLLDATLRQQEHQIIANLLTDLKLEPTAVRLQRVGTQARRIADRLGKPDLQVRVDSSDLRLDPVCWSSFWAAFIHIVRNAVDHGIERREDRLAAGKSPGGRLDLCSRLQGDRLLIEVVDDGRGINWEKVRERALERGMPHESQQDLQAALFQDGVSTADQVTEFSGRGVGLGAILESTQALGGEIEIDSTPGKGTRFTFSFPKQAVAPSAEEMMARSRVQRRISRAELAATSVRGAQLQVPAEQRSVAPGQ